MLVPPVPGPRHDLARVALVLLLRRVALEPDVVADVKVEQRPALAARPARDELVEGDVVGQDAVLLDVEEVGGGGGAELSELGGELGPVFSFFFFL